jgi:hypothetical protein
MKCRSPITPRDPRRAPRVRPTLEQLEARDVPASGFLQGTAFIDSNHDGQIDSGDPPQANALIQLYQVGAPSTLLATTNADANGNYRFTNLAPGNYRIVDATPGYQTTAATGSSPFDPSSIAADNSINVTVLDTSAVQVTYQSRPLFETVHLTLNGVALYEYVSQRVLTATGGGLGSNVVTFYSFCTDLTQDLSLGAVWNASTPPADSVLPNNSGRIGYLYNHYGTVLRNSNADAAGLQIAIWELEYDATPDLSSGNFVYGYSDADDAAVRAAAQFYIADSAGKNETAIYLSADSSISNGLQSAIATGSFNFLSAPQSGSISGTKYQDLTGNGISADDTPLGGVTIKLYSGNSATGTPIATTTTANDGTYSFGKLAPGTYFVQETVPSGWTQTAGASGYVVTVAPGSSNTGNNFADFKNITISGVKVLDPNGTGFSASDTPLGGVTIDLFKDVDGNGVLTAADGGPVATTMTACDGSYSFTNLGPGTYFVQEVVPAVYVQTAGGPSLDASGNSYYTVAAQSGTNVTNENFADFHSTSLTGGDTATIGFWANRNGQALILSLNGGPTSRALGNWLASNFSNLYGAQAGTNDLAGKTNTQVATYFVSLFRQQGQKLGAQVLATALAVYATDATDAGGTYAAKYGFIVNDAGTRAATYNIGTNGAAFGVANNTTLTIWQILVATNASAVGGLLWNGNTTFDNLGNVVFSGVNQGGDI